MGDSISDVPDVPDLPALPLLLPPQRESDLSRLDRLQPRAPNPRSATLRRDLFSSSSDAVAFSLMVGAGETYIPALALALGAGDTVAGLIASVPLFAGALLQMVSPHAVLWLGSHRRWVVLCAAVQATSFVPLIVGSVLGRLPLAVLFAAASLYWAAGMATGPTWNTWIETLLPAPLRTRFLARRSRISQLAVLAGLLAGSLVLSAGERAGRLLLAFSLLFGFAAVARLVSASFLARQSEPEPLPSGFRNFGFVEVLTRVRRRADSHLLVYLLFLQISVFVAAPFFTPYMLGPLDLSYTRFMLLVGASFVAKALLLPALGNFARHSGARRLLWIGAVGVAPLAAMWTVSRSFSYLLGLQLVAGVMWGAHELAVLLLFFETIPRAERTSMLTFFNFANASALLIGSSIGASLLSRFDGAAEGYAVIFGVSTCGRVASLLLLRRLPDVSGATETPILGTLGLRPSLGGIDRPVLAGLGESPDETQQVAIRDEAQRAVHP
jgi:MFS family permease